MRTTITLDPDVAELVRKRMHERGLTFKEAVNDAIRSSAVVSGEPFRTRTASLGITAVNLDRALQIAAELEDDELVRKMRNAS